MKVDPLLVSNSEADSYLTCQRKHYYAYTERLQPRTYGPGITRGNIVHYYLEHYYNAIKGGAAFDMAANFANTKLNQLYFENAGNNSDPDLWVKTRALLEEYVVHYAEEDSQYEILAVEHVFVSGHFPFQPDIIKRHKASGRVIVSDHKTLYNFYTNTIIELFPQLAKYVGHLRKLGYEVWGAEYDMLRHRQNAREKFKRYRFPIPEKRIQRFMWEHDETAAKILAMRSVPVEVVRQRAIRTANSFTCGNCWFEKLCTHDLHEYNGRERLVQAEYTESTYGYGEMENDD